ncbi:MAG: hypothetical protein ABI026_01175 [Gemmatimonadaceae bacterium]
MRNRLRVRISTVTVVAALGSALLFSSCTDDVATAPRSAASLSPLTAQLQKVSLPAVQPGDSAKADTLARAVALTLGNAAIRQHVLADLRDSPFSEHGIDLSSYLGGSQGHAVAAAVAQRVGITPERLIALASVRGGLQLSMPISSDRSKWSGSDSVVVTGTPFTVREDVTARHRPFGYTIRGDTTSTPFLSPMPFALFVIGPAEHSFGPTPEATRSAAPKHSRNTITTPAEELRASYVPPAGGVTPYTMPCNNDCGGDGGGSGGGLISGVYLPSFSTMASCVPNAGAPIPDQLQDVDRDGVQDQCEYEIANSFRPQMRYMSNDCQTSREPYWAAHYLPISPVDGSGPVIQVFYAIGYHYDCGCPGLNGLPDCGPHYGDSEFIVMEMRPDGPDPHLWMLRYATLSAHYGTRLNSTGTYWRYDLEYDNAPGGSMPVVWVSEGKHGNYRSQAVCDAGAAYFDNCDHPLQQVWLEASADANLGSRYYRQNEYTYSRVGGAYTGQEHMWSLDNSTDDGFLGWWPRSYGSGERPYGSLLENYGF